jgi:putative ABC transport system permease protein
MPVLFRIAFRNLLEHKAKSLIIGILLTLGVVILIVGNAFMDTAAKGVKDTFIANYTGDIFISAKAKSPISLFGIQSMGQRETTPIIPEFDRIMAKLASDKAVAGASSQVTSYGLISKKGSDKQGFALLFGIDPATYYDLFQNAVPLEGTLLRPGEEGIVISKKQAERYKENAGFEPAIGDTLFLTGMGKSSFNIRPVTLRGIVEYKNETEATDFISYADVDTVRILAGLTIGGDADFQATEEQIAALEASDDDFFGTETVIEASDIKKASSARAESRPAETPAAAARVDSGAWHFALARLHNPSGAKTYAASLNLWFAQEGIDAQAAEWKTAAGPFAQSIDVVRIVFNIAIIIVAVVAVIIMMNTLVISVIERTGEIGTMRALGAQRGFVRRMFLVETLAIAAVFGFIGIVLALAAVGILSAAHIQASNPFLQILFAGKELHLLVDPASVALSLVLVGLVAVIAHIYPVSIALKIQPVRAMQNE